MSACVSKNNSLGFPYLNEHPHKTKPKQGISTILGYDWDSPAPSATPNRATPPPLPTLRRTLSADMSSRKWLAQNGCSTYLKKIASSEKLQSLDSSPENSSSSSSDSDADERRLVIEGQGAFDAIWKSIQEEQRKKELERPGQSDTWGSILSQKANDAKSGDGGALPPPYVHPLVKRSASSLSGKSLEICTESLGSETGSDGFSSYPPSEPGDSEDDKEEEETRGEVDKDIENSQPFDGEEFEVVKYNYASSWKRAPPRSFPPPLRSLAHRDGSNVHMRSHRQNGRLVVEAVAVPSQNCFRAQRQDGRLLLTLNDNTTEQDEEINAEDYEEDNEVESRTADNSMAEDVDEIDEVGKEAIEEEEEEVQDEDVEAMTEENNDSAAALELASLMESISVRKLPAGMMNVHKLIGLTNSTTWDHKFNKVFTTLTDAQEEEGEEEVEVVKSALPPRTQVARLIPTTQATSTATLNAYEYNWRTKQTGTAATATAVAVLKPSQKPPVSVTPPLEGSNYNINKFVMGQNLNSSAEQKEMVVVQGKRAEDLAPVPVLRNCKEQRRRSLLLWEPYCIATS
ncbi:hypothetical protein Ancab_007472 [Ancistrocladus abbreviatus]